MKYEYVSETESEYPDLKEGVATFEVIKATERQSQNGNDMLEIVCKVLDSSSQTGQVYCFLVGLPSMAWKIKHFCESIGKPEWYSESSPEIKAENLIGKSGKCDLEMGKERVVEDRTYPAKIEIKDFISVGKAVVEKKEFIDDDIPF